MDAYRPAVLHALRDLARAQARTGRTDRPYATARRVLSAVLDLAATVRAEGPSHRCTTRQWLLATHEGALLIVERSAQQELASAWQDVAFWSREVSTWLLPCPECHERAHGAPTPDELHELFESEPGGLGLPGRP